MTVEDLLQQALTEEAAAVPAPADRWTEIEAEATARRLAERRHARRRTRGLTALGVAAAAVAAAFALPALTHEPTHRVVVTPAGPTGQTTVVAPQPHPSTTVGSPPASVTTVPKTVPTTVPAGSAYQPLYPFRTLTEANAWQAAYQQSGDPSQAWHLDAGQTALHFTAFLGYTDVTTVFATRYDTSGAHVTVGFPNPNGDPVDAAVLHLRRFGTGGNSSPWEVVGTDDTANFSLTTPRYSATGSSPLAVGGAIVGVDESIRVEVLQASSTTPLGVFCCQPAGNSGLPWGAHVTFHGATDKVLIVAASTGGHLAAVERFTVTGVRTAAGTTPGL